MAQHRKLKGNSALAGKNTGSFLVPADARRIRETICQYSLRPIFSDGVSGDPLERVEKITARIIFSLLKESAEKRPLKKGDVARSLGVKASRIASMFNPDKNCWPSTELTPAEALARITFRVFFDEDSATRWRDVLENGHNGSNLRAANAASSDEDRLRGIACDLIDFFFPLEHRQRNLTKPPNPKIYEPPPYFQASRVHWGGPFDRHELAQMIHWIRRVTIWDNQRGLLGLFIPTVDAANVLIDETFIAPAIGLTALHHPELFPVHFYYPRGGDEQAIDKVLTQVHERVQRAGLQAKAALKRQGRPVLFTGDRTPNVQMIPERTTKVVAKPLRGIITFLIGFYGRIDPPPSQGVRRYKFVYILRPYLPEGEDAPVAIRLTQPEADRFIEAAMGRYTELADRIGRLSI